MIRRKSLAWCFGAPALAALAVAVLLGMPRNVHAAPADWFEYTNETGNNDLTDTNNWRWAHDTGMPGGVTAWGHPTSQVQLETTRLFVSGAGSGMSFNQGNVYDFADVGNGKTFALNNAQLDAGATLNVHGTGVLTTTGLSANGLGLNVVRDMPTGLGGDGWGNTMRYYRIDSNPVNWTNSATYGLAGLPSGNKNWFGNNKETTLHVFSGGTFTNIGGTDAGIDSGIGPIGHLGYDLDSTAGAIHVSVAGGYNFGGISGKGGGFLTLRGYDPLTTITMGSMRIASANAGVGINPFANASTGMTGVYGLYGVSTGGSTDGTNLPGGGAGAGFYYPGGNYLVNTFGSADVPLAFDSKQAQVRVHLTSQNAGGLFNSVNIAGNLRIDNLAAVAGYNTVPDFLLYLDGYTPDTGDVFAIMKAAQDVGHDGTPGTLGAFDKGWATSWSQDGATWELLNNFGGVAGIYLHVIQGIEAASVPEPSSIALGIVGLMGLSLFGWKQRRRKAVAA